MKKFIPFLFVIFLVACDKDKFETKPQIEVESFNTEVLPPHANLIVTLNFTDKEGDLGRGELTYIPVSLNKRKLPQDLEYAPIPLPIPEFSDHNKGDFQIELEWKWLQRSPVVNDTIKFQFVAVDRAGNRSDTVESGQVVILRQ